MYLPVAGLEIVEKKLQESRERIEARKTMLDEMRETPTGRIGAGEAYASLTDPSRMFERRGEGEAFHPLTELELAVLENQIEQYQKSGQFDILGDDGLDHYYDATRFNLLTGNNWITPDEFRRASGVITNRIFDYLDNAVTESSRIKPRNTVVTFVWRAGLAFADAARNHGFYHFAHIGASRSEETLATKTYYKYFPKCVDLTNTENNRGTKGIIVDPMLATGNTDICAIELLKQTGFEEKNITILAVISAPEGVHQIFCQFPNVKIITGCHDERLNERGYIEPGLGDYGDKYSEGQGPEQVADLCKQGIITDLRTERALLERMGFVPPSR